MLPVDEWLDPPLTALAVSGIFQAHTVLKLGHVTIITPILGVICIILILTLGIAIFHMTVLHFLYDVGETKTPKIA